MNTIHKSCPSCEGELETYGIELWAKVEEATLNETPYFIDVKGSPSESSDDPDTGLYPRDDDWGLSCVNCGMKIPATGRISPAIVLKLGTLMLPADLYAVIADALGYVANDYAERAGFEQSLSRGDSDEHASYVEAATRFSTALDRINDALKDYGD